MNLARRTAAEALGTALLLAAVVGSGIMGERLAGGNVAIALLANTIATGATLFALILTLGPVWERISIRRSRSRTLFSTDCPGVKFRPISPLNSSVLSEAWPRRI